MNRVRIGGLDQRRRIVLGKLSICLEEVVPGGTVARADRQVPRGGRVGFEETQPDQGSDRFGADDLLRVEIVHDEAPALGPAFGDGGLEISNTQLVPPVARR